MSRRTKSTSTKAAKTLALPSFDLESFADKGYLTHSLHPYPAKFVPQLPQILLKAFCPLGGLVVDPFCGSGTSIVEAALFGANAIGSDLHPLAVMLTKAKTARLNTSQLRELKSFHKKCMLNWRPGELSKIDPPQFLNRDKWFTKEATQDLAYLKQCILEVDDPVLRNILLVCFSAIIVKASNQESDTRWKAIDKGYTSGNAIKFFSERLILATERLTDFADRAAAETTIEVLQENAQNLNTISSASADMLVTSPPYANSYDYYLYHKLRTFWLGIDHHAFQGKEIGSRHRHSDLGEGVEIYQREMKLALTEGHRILKPGASATYIIGDSVIRGEFIKMDKLYIDIATSVGFQFADKFSYNQRKYSKAFTPNLRSAPKETHILLFEKI